MPDPLQDQPSVPDPAPDPARAQVRGQPRPTPLDLGAYGREAPPWRPTGIEITAAILTCLWLGTAFLLDAGDADAAPVALADRLLQVVFVVLPVALIWVAAGAARTARALREEAARLQAAIDAMRAAYVTQAQRATLDLRPNPADRPANPAETAPPPVGPRPGVFAGTEPMFASLRLPPQPAPPPAEPYAAPAEPAPPISPHAPDPSQARLALATPAERAPLAIADFIKALNFPENEHDTEGFRTLRRALEDRATERLIRAAQDVLTLLSQDGIYMDDLTPDRARPEVWRRFAQGERGRAVAALGGIHDRSSLALAAGRMKKDPVFRDAAHHFLRHFDRSFTAFEQVASDADIAALSETRTARAFMLLGRVAGTFD